MDYNSLVIFPLARTFPYINNYLSLIYIDAHSKATTMRLLVSHYSVLSTSTRVGCYFRYSLLWFLWLVGKLEQSKPRKQQCSEKFGYGYHFQVAFKELPWQ